MMNELPENQIPALIDSTSCIVELELYAGGDRGVYN